MSTYSLLLSDGTTSQEFSEGYTGTGTATYEDGSTYVGEFVDGLKQGETGVYTYPTENVVYSGGFSADKKHGQGTLTIGDKIEYHGNFENGLFKTGNVRYQNNDYYEGEFNEKLQKHGKGSYYFYKERSKLTGEWVEGQIISGKYELLGGRGSFQGNFKYNQPIGEVTWKLQSGNITGNYKQTKRPLDFAKDDPRNPPMRIEVNWETTQIN
jgi:hypothetical protein